MTQRVSFECHLPLSSSPSMTGCADVRPGTFTGTTSTVRLLRASLPFVISSQSMCTTALNGFSTMLGAGQPKGWSLASSLVLVQHLSIIASKATTNPREMQGLMFKRLSSGLGRSIFLVFELCAVLPQSDCGILHNTAVHLYIVSPTSSYTTRSIFFRSSQPSSVAPRS